MSMKSVWFLKKNRFCPKYTGYLNQATYGSEWIFWSTIEATTSPHDIWCNSTPDAPYPFQPGMEVVLKTWGGDAAELGKFLQLGTVKAITNKLSGLLEVETLTQVITVDADSIIPRYYEGGYQSTPHEDIFDAILLVQNTMLNQKDKYEPPARDAWHPERSRKDRTCPHCSFLNQDSKSDACQMCSLPFNSVNQATRLAMAGRRRPPLLFPEQPEIPEKVRQLRKRILHLSDIVQERLTEDRSDREVFLERLRASEMDLREMWQTLFSMDATALEWLSTTSAMDIVMNPQHERISEDLSGTRAIEEDDQKSEL